LSKAAATELSTPPDMATTTRVRNPKGKLPNPGSYSSASAAWRKAKNASLSG